MNLALRKSSTLPVPAVLQQAVAAGIDQPGGELALSKKTGITRAVLLKLALGRPCLIGTLLRAALVFGIDLTGQIEVVPATPAGVVDPEGKAVEGQP